MMGHPRSRSSKGMYCTYIHPTVEGEAWKEHRV
jgi:hypothetical protein